MRTERVIGCEGWCDCSDKENLSVKRGLTRKTRVEVGPECGERRGRHEVKAMHGCDGGYQLPTGWR